ncbi:MAG TPA: hypothetical protein VMH48_01725, partial [Methylomirabilota bacterium]|nr:hypothetical protein [Methylomirabilota bacterium]
LSLLAPIAAGLSLLASGCKHEPPITSAVVEVSDWKSLALPVEILVDGASVGSFSARSFAVDIPPGTISVVARVGLPCRVKEINVPLRPPTDKELAEDKQTDHGPARRGNVSIFVNELMSKFWIDNREGAAAHVKIGQLEFDLPADSSPILEVPTPLCENIYVKVNGEDLGPWPKAPANAEAPSNPNFEGMAVTASNSAALNLLLDVRGYHCYNYLKVQYAQYPQAYAYTAGYTTGTALNGHRLYALPIQPDYFLTPAPKSVQANANQGTAVRSQLTEAACPR